MSVKNPERILISVIVPVYNEEDNLPVFYKRLSKTFENKDYNVEFIFVNDGSSDDSLKVLRHLRQGDCRIKIIDFSRNFGPWEAITAGIHHAKGNFVTWISADLQDPPEILPNLILQALQGNDVVWGVRSERHDPLFRRVTAKIFYRILRRIALPNYPILGTDLCCMSQRVVHEFRQLEERNRFTQGLIMSLGFSQVFVPYKREARLRGQSSWNQFEKLLNIGMDMIISLSQRPLRLMLYMGLLLAFFSVILVVYVLISKFLLGSAVSGWASLMIVIAFFGGLNAMMLGILGEYVWRILQETKKRPLYIIKEKIGFDEVDEPKEGGAKSNHG